MTILKSAVLATLLVTASAGVSSADTYAENRAEEATVETLKRTARLARRGLKAVTTIYDLGSVIVESQNQGDSVVETGGKIVGSLVIDAFEGIADVAYLGLSVIGGTVSLLDWALSD